MNKVILIGRLTRDPEIRYLQNEKNTVVAKYTLAVDRRFKKYGENEADFLSCTVFGKGAEFAEKYLFKGTRVAVSGRIETGSYTNKDGAKVYTTDIIVDEQEFAESKPASNSNVVPKDKTSVDNSFVNVPDEVDEELPFA